MRTVNFSKFQSSRNTRDDSPTHQESVTELQSSEYVARNGEQNINPFGIRRSRKRKVVVEKILTNG